jgi:DHA1 family tetracycline resistance protein-like MFS transporter
MARCASSAFALRNRRRLHHEARPVFRAGFFYRKSEGRARPGTSPLKPKFSLPQNFSFLFWDRALDLVKVCAMPARKPALGFIFVTLLLDVLGLGLIIPILPRLVESFAHHDVVTAARLYGALGALYALMQFICAPIIGSLSDRFGRRKVILASLFASALDYVILIFAPNMGWLFIGRILTGITGANFSAAMAYIADVSPPEKRAANFGVMGAAFGLGFIAGPALGGLLGKNGFFGIDPLRAPFVAAGILTLCNWLYGCFVLPESLAPENRRPFSWARSNPVGALRAFRSHPAAIELATTYFLLNLAHQVFPATWVLYTEYRYKWDSFQTGLSLTVVGVVVAFVQGGLTRVVVKKLGERKTILTGMTIATLAYIGYGSASVGWLVYLILCFGALGGVTMPTVQSVISRQVGPDEQGRLQGALMSVASITGILGPAILTTLFSYSISPRAPFHLPGSPYYFSAILVVAAMLTVGHALRRAKPLPPKPTPTP